jgi:molybdopterin-guanine dinucleotide biosynthesis protein B
MKVLGFAGYSGSGKTTLIEQVIAGLRQRGLRVSVIKHAHHGFDIDREGKDTWRHRKAGAYEVLIASARRMALMRENETEREPDVHALLATLDAGVDWALIEGFKDADLPKIALWRAPQPGQRERPAPYPHDAHVVAVATDGTPLPAPTALPVLDARAPETITRWMLAQGARFDYHPHPRSPQTQP